MPQRIEALPGDALAGGTEDGVHLEDVPMRAEAVLDSLNLNVKALTSLRVGSVIRLSRSAGSDIDLYVGPVPLACGKVVVIEDRMGLRITGFTFGG